jgi:hypothetical protein
MENAYTKTPAEALRHFQVAEDKGLSEQQVRTLREKHGKNGMLDNTTTCMWRTMADAREPQRFQKTRQRPSGSSFSSSSRTSSSSSCSARPRSHLCLHSSKTARAGQLL